MIEAQAAPAFACQVERRVRAHFWRCQMTIFRLKAKTHKAKNRLIEAAKV